MILKTGQLVTANVKDLKYVDIYEKDSCENDEESKYNFLLNTNENILNRKNSILLEFQNEGYFKEPYTGTIICILDSDTSFDISLKKDYQNMISLHMEHPLYIDNYKCIDEVGYSYIDNLDIVQNELTSIYNFAQSNLEDKHQEIIDNDSEYKNKKIQVLKLGGMYNEQ